MTIIYTDEDLKPEAQGKLIEEVALHDLEECSFAASAYADLVWFERSFSWGKQRRTLKHRNGPLAADGGVIVEWN